MRTVLIGSVESTAVALEAFIESHHPPAVLVTLALDRAARHSDFVDLRPMASRAGVRVLEAVNVNAPELLAQIREIAPDILFVVGWSQLFGQELVALGRLGCIGYHPALLPTNRGRGVIPWTILQRATETGSTFFWVDEGMDSGDIVSQERFAVAPDETARTLYDKHMASIGRQLRSLLPRLAEGDAPRCPQDNSAASYCARRSPDDGHVDWRASADDVWTLIRASGDPYPGAFSFWRGRTLRIWDAQFVGPAPYFGLPGQIQRLDNAGALVRCGDGEHVLLRRVQVESEEPAAPASIMRNHEKLGLDILALQRALNGEIQR